MNEEQPRDFDKSIAAISEAFKSTYEAANMASETLQVILDMEIKYVQLHHLCQKIKLRTYFIQINKSHFPLRLLYVYRYNRLLKRYKSPEESVY